MSTKGQRLRALRGATTVMHDDPDAVHEATVELLTEMFSRNGVAADDVVSVVFTATPDLTSEFPAVAARALGLSDVPLLCAAEIAVEGALPRCIRVLLHLYTDLQAGELRHVYLREARALRADLG
jgi:chorismate mutase